MLLNIHYFQKYNRYNFLESYLYCNNGVWNLDREHLQCVVPENIHTPPWRVFSSLTPHPLGFSISEGFTLLPPPLGISMIFPLGPSYP